MAEVVAINLQVDGGNSYKQIKKLEDGISDLIDETNELNETNLQFKKELQELTNAYNELPKSQLSARAQIKSQMEELKFAIKDNNIALQEFRIKKAQKQKMINDLKGVQKEAKKTTQELGNIAEGVGQGYKAFLGVTTALGGSNEKLIEAYVKLEGITKGLEGFEKLRKMGLKDSAFLTSALSVKTKVLTGIQKAYTLAVGTSTKAMKGLKTALLATGVGAIIVALGTIVAYWEDIKGAVSGLSKEQKKRNADLEKEKELTQANLDNIDATENTLRLQGKSEQEILDMKLAQLDIQLDQQRQTIENAKVQKQTQIEASERNNKIAQNTIRILSLPITMLLGAIDMLTYGLEQVGLIEEATNLEESFSGGLASMLFDPEEVAKEGDDTIAEAEKKLAELQNKRDGFTLAEQEKRKVASDKAIEEKKKEDERLAKLEEEKLEKLKELKEEFTDLQNQEIEDENQRAITQLETEQKRELDALREKYGKNTELEKQLLINQKLEMDALKEEQRLAEEQKLKENQASINEILKQFDLDSIEDTFEKARKELEIQKNADLEKLKLAEATQEQIDQINNIYSEKSKKLAEDELEFKKKLKKEEVNQALGATADVLGSIVSLVGEGSKVGKAAAIAQTTISTYLGAQQAYASVVGTPIVGPVLAPIAAGVAIANGIKSIKKIVSTKIPGGGMSGGSGITPPTFSTPTTTTSGTAPTGNNNNGINNVPTTKVVLVESELQAMQTRRTQVDTIATI
jgi:hypothetical protein